METLRAVRGHLGLSFSGGKYRLSPFDPGPLFDQIAGRSYPLYYDF